MTNISNLLKGISPKTKRVSINMPLNEWIDKFNKGGILIIDAYVSSKKEENPDGYQTSKLRKIFASGDSNLEPEINHVLEQQFATAFYTVGVNDKKRTVFIVVAPSNKAEMETAGYSLKPMAQAQRTKKAKKPVVTEDKALSAKLTAEIKEKKAIPTKKGKTPKK